MLHTGVTIRGGVTIVPAVLYPGGWAWELVVLVERVFWWGSLDNDYRGGSVSAWRLSDTLIFGTPYHPITDSLWGR